MTSVLNITELQCVSPAGRAHLYAQMHAGARVSWDSSNLGWLVTRYADVSQLLRNPEALAVDAAPQIDAITQRGGPQLPYLSRFCRSLSMFTRPPRHDVVRGVLAEALSEARRQALRAKLTSKAEQLLDAGERAGSMDLAADYGRPLALFVISNFLGIDSSHLPNLSRLAHSLTVLFDSTHPSLRTLIQTNRWAKELIDFFAELICDRRSVVADDGLSLLIRLADLQLGCNDEELAAYCVFFFVAAEETTAAALSESARLLLERPALRTTLAAEPSLHSAAAREFSRLASPIQYIARVLSCGQKIGGIDIPAGNELILMLGAANRDPTVFPNPDEPLLDRAGPAALEFGAGAYRCIGSAVALLEIETAVTALVGRPHLRLMPVEPTWTNRVNIAALEHLPATFQ